MQKTNDCEHQFMAYMAEYSAMRDEIGWLINGATQYQNFAIVLVAAYLGFLVTLGDHASTYVIYVFLFAPLSLCLLGFLYFRQHEEVYVIARYIDTEIVTRARECVNVQDVFHWERFKADQTSVVKPAARLIHFLRMLLFLAPSLFSLVVACPLISWSTLSNAWMHQTPFIQLCNSFGQALLYICGVAAFISFTVYAISFANLPKRFLTHLQNVAPRRS